MVGVTHTLHTTTKRLAITALADDPNYFDFSQKRSLDADQGFLRLAGFHKKALF